MYQVDWQRALFTIYGVNIESVTIIVTVFMLGLGLGSLAGGQLSKKRDIPLLLLFGGIELSIGAFGMFSMTIFRTAAIFTAGASSFETAFITFWLLLIPTALMGSTLPILTAYLVRIDPNVGKAVGALYAVNTFGSSAACFLAAAFVMRHFGESGSVQLAAGMNICVACAAFLAHFKRRAPDASNPERSEHRPAALKFGIALVISAVAGFIALGYEILWYRLYSFVTGGPSSCFAMMLGWYLAGVAYGSLAVRDMCSNRLQHGGAETVSKLYKVLLWGSTAAFLIGPVVAIVAVPLKSAPYSLVFVGAAILGAVFPLVSHASVQPDTPDAGAKLSYLYLSNVLGCTAGSLGIGFVLMNFLSTHAIAIVLLSAGLITAVTLIAIAGQASARTLAVAVAGAALVLVSWPFYSNIYERLLIAQGFPVTLRHVVETRSGVIAVDDKDIVFGGGVYDGRYNTDLVSDSNGIYRAFATDAFHTHPEDVLVIGLSSGSWAQVLANNPRVKNVTVIEINAGYLGLIPKYPAVASLLKNPKVRIYVDDGRRWLVRNPAARFDLVVSNTSFHWRAHTANLLSAEFLSLIRKHLKPGGIHYYNTTSSSEALLTGATVFPYALRVYNFLAVSDSPIVIDKERWQADLRTFSIDGTPVLESEAGDRRVRQLLAMMDSLDGRDGSKPGDPTTIESGTSLRARLQGARMVTDDNMATEWK
jgi:spermidine synthase